MNFFTMNPNLKKKYFLGVVGGGGGGTGLQLLQNWGHNNALMYELCP